MDNNNSNKTSNFFKKEGFYVILFLCICIAATVAAVSVKNSKNAKNITPKTKTVSEEKTSKEVAENAEEKTQEKRVDYTNALEVKNDSKVEAAQKAVVAVKNGKNEVKANASAKVSSTVDAKFAKPVEGELVRGYSDLAEYKSGTNVRYAKHFGIDIRANLGVPVFSVMDGKVEKVEKNCEDGDGTSVTINHQNGLKSKYCNLNEVVKVKVGQNVKKGEQIANVGRTTLSEGYEEYGDHLHFEVLNGKEPVDPEKYVKYEK